MGLTVHYSQGKAESRAKIDEIIKRLADIATLAKWEYWLTDEPNFEDWRTNKPYHHKGICINVDEGCETLEIAFDYDTLDFKHGFTKTQYSQDFIGTHHAICTLLDLVKNEYVKGLQIADEGDYYGNWNKEALGVEIKEWEAMINKVGDMLRGAIGDKGEIIMKPKIVNGEIKE